MMQMVIKHYCELYMIHLIKQPDIIQVVIVTKVHYCLNIIISILVCVSQPLKTYSSKNANIMYFTPMC